MIAFEEACKIACDFYEKTLGIQGIYKPYDIGDAWVFNGGREEERRIGVQKIAVSKTDGGIRAFNLPSKKNFALLEAGTEVELPEQYR